MDALIHCDPRPKPRARIVSADWTQPDPTSVVSMIWLCECGHTGINVAGVRGWCPGCKGEVVIPSEPLRASPDEVRAALGRGCVTCNGCTPAGFKCRSCEAEA